MLKWQCHENFCHFFILWIEPNWAPDKQAKMVLLKNLFSRRYSNVKVEKFDSAVLVSAESNLLLPNISQKLEPMCSFSFFTENFAVNLYWLTQHGVRLHIRSQTTLVESEKNIFRKSKIDYYSAESDSAQITSAQSQILPRLPLGGVRFCPDYLCAESDSAQTTSARSQTLPRLPLRGVRFCPD